jgi:hypothetical protein
LPAAFDACLVVDHARLPDLSWLSALARRYLALKYVELVESMRGRAGMSPAMKNGVQVACDGLGELPFGVALRYGNGRIDHSCIVVAARDDAKLPVSLSWQAAGEFEHERWRDAAASPRLAADHPLLTGTLAVEPTRVAAAVGEIGPGEPRPELAAELLQNQGLALRVIVPATSRYWTELASLELPPTRGAELRIACGDPAIVVLTVEVKDQATAEAWIGKGRELLVTAKAELERALPAAVLAHPDAERLLPQLLGPALAVKGDTAFATFELTGVTPAVVRSLVEACFAK